MPPKTYCESFSDGVAEYELDAVEARRWHVHGERVPGEEMPPNWDMPKDDPLTADLVGLAFSGGGIRSATFNLGILQALGRLKLITRLDYLSTVSGGGYIGGWLAAWVRRAADDRPAGAEIPPNWTAVEAVEGRLDPRTNRRRSGEITDEHEADVEREREPEPETVHHLREHSRYLAVWGGVSSDDFWALVGIYTRNLLVNLLIVVPLVMVVALLCRLAVVPFASPRPSDELAWVVFVLSAGALLVSFALSRRGLGRMAQSPRPPSDRPADEAAPPADGRGRHRPVPRRRRTDLDPPADGRWERLLIIGLMLASGFGGVWLLSAAGGPVPVGEEKSRVGSEAADVWEWAQRTFPGLAPAGEDGRPPTGTLLRRDVLLGLALGLGLALIGAASAVYTTRKWAAGRAADRGGTGARWASQAALAVFYALFLSQLLAVGVNAVVYAGGAVRPALTATFGPVLFMAAVLLAGYVETAVAGRYYSEFEREWRSRIGGEILRLCLVWILLLAFVLYVPWVIGELALQAGAIGQLIPWGAALGWVAAAAGGAFITRRPDPSKPGLNLARVAGVAPVLFLIGLLALASTAAANLPAFPGVPEKREVAEGRPGYEPRWGHDDWGYGWSRSHFVAAAEDAAPGHVVAWLAVFGVSTLLALVLVPATQFSLHSLYMNRLVRCYLGASRADPDPAGARDGACAGGEHLHPRRGRAALDRALPRRADPYTGLDPNDDLPLSALRVRPDDLPSGWRADDECGWGGVGPYLGPYPIFNTTLNLVAGDELAYQDRKGSSFVLTPDYCGSRETGYALLGADEDAARNLTVGRAVTVSGAAIDPNMGVYQSGPLTALLAILNARLGCWVENPRASAPVRGHDRRPWTAAPPGAPWAGWPFVREMLGMTRAEGGHVHLSDGGHFENTGAYELIRRRCRHVVVIDAAEDRADASENLASLVRLVRTDFGIPIEIDTSPVRKDDAGLSRWHCAVGVIRYDEVDPSGVTGTLVFVRPSMTGDEEPDLRNYAANNPAFPHHSTADQFFDEAQFESYRALGFHVGLEVFGRARQEVEEPPRRTAAEADYRGYTRRLFAALRRAWSPLPAGLAEAYARSARDYLKAVADLRDRTPSGRAGDRGLRQISRGMFPEARAIPAPPRRTRYASSHPAGVSTDAYFTDLHEVEYLLQVMELAWMENGLDRFGGHPQHRGWMNVLRRWTTTGSFHRFWPVLRGHYSREFVRFCTVALNLGDPPVRWCRVTNPTGPGWAGVLRDLGVEFQREWAESLRGIERIDTPETQQRYLPAAVEASAAARAGGPLAWVLTTGHPGEPDGLIEDEADWVRPLPPAEYDPPHATGETPVRYPSLGVVVAFPPTDLRGRLGLAPLDRDPEGWELLVWVRGPHRTLGLARAALPRLLANEAAPSPRPGAARPGLMDLLPDKVSQVFVRYPQLSTTAGDRLQLTVWKCFFNDNDFVADPGELNRDWDPRRAEPKVVRLVRKRGFRSANMVPHNHQPGPGATPPVAAPGGGGPG